MSNDTLDKIDDAIKKLQNMEESTIEIEKVDDTDTKIFDGSYSVNDDTKEIDNVVVENKITKKNNDNLILILYIIGLIITVILVLLFILFLY